MTDTAPDPIPVETEGPPPDPDAAGLIPATPIPEEEATDGDG